MSNETISGCSCTTAEDPRVVRNPPGLPEISYRVDDFAGFRRALLRPLAGEQAIGAWRPAPGDLGLQVLEWWAYLADVLTFYNERIANESYLRTATQAGSVAGLVAPLGYQPAPGIAATGHLAAVSTAGGPAEPLVIPAGMRLSSTASPGVPAQTFEVDSPGVSFTGQSTVPVTLPPQTKLKLNTDGTPQSVLLAGRVSGVKAGDQLVLADSTFAGDNDNWSLVTVSALTPETDPGTGVINTQVTYTGGWGPTSTPPGSPKAPRGPEPSSDSTKYRLMRPTAVASLWNLREPSSPVAHGQEPPGPAKPTPIKSGLSKDELEYEHSEEQVVIEAAGSPRVVREVHLSAAVRAISPGELVLFDCGAGKPSALAVVTGTSEVLWAVRCPQLPGASPSRPPEIVIDHTVLSLQLADPDSDVLRHLNERARRTVAVRYHFIDVGTIIGVPVPSLTQLPQSVGVPAPHTLPSAGATAFLQDATGAGMVITVGKAGQGQVTLTGVGVPAPALTAKPAPLPAPLPVPLQLLLHIVPVSRGTTVTGEVLGSGNAALANQSFTLAKSPLTYLAGGNGPVSILTVSVDQIEWQDAPSFYGQAATARLFVVTRSPDQSVTTVTFGDGVNGARLTSGTGNVTATYRYGSGKASPLPGHLTTITQPQLRLASIQNPVAVSGGADPQAPEDVRTGAPASVVTLGRAISAADYEHIASQAPGVSRAAAYWTFDGAEQRTLVTVYVSGDHGAVAGADAALAAAEDPNRPVSVVRANPIDLALSCTLVVAAGQQVDAVVAAAVAAISDSAAGLFSPGRIGIGQPLYRSAIDTALMVPGVAAVHDLKVTGANQVVGEVLDPGQGSFFAAPGKTSIHGVKASG